MAIQLPVKSPQRQAWQDEVLWALREVESPAGKGVFPKNQAIEYGAFYAGWSNYLRGNYIHLSGEGMQSDHWEAFENQCDSIAQALNGAAGPFPESYPGAAWPADGVVATASLALHDRLSRPRYSKTLTNWVANVREQLDTIGLIRHCTRRPQTVAETGSRGCSQSLMLCFLPEIDQNFANEQFARYQQHFVDSAWGLPGIREYPKGNSGWGDVDSGPVVVGMGASATIVGLRTLWLYGDTARALQIRNGLEAFGFAHAGKTEKRYLFGALPIADAFLAWSNAAAPVFAETSEPPMPSEARFPIEAGSAILLLLILISLVRIWNRPFAEPTQS